MTDYTFPMTISEGEEILDERALLRDIESGMLMNSADSVRYIVIHCSATREDKDYTVAQLMRDHRARGFRTIGYHFYIRRSGIVSQHRKLLEVGAHARPYNRCSIGICYEGGLDSKGHPADTRTPEQKEEMRSLIMKLRKSFPKAKVVGHRDLPGATPKECPCFDAEWEFG